MTRAVENGVYLVSSYTYSHGTMILSPDGTIINEAGTKGFAFAEVDLNKQVWYPWLSCNSCAEPNPTYLMERRPELYGILSAPIKT